MEFVVTPAEQAFRAEVRDWLTDNVPREKLPPITHDGAAHRAFLLAWQKQQHDAGWAGIDWPTQYGGRGLSIQEQVIWFEEYARAGGPHAGGLFPALKHAGPTLILRGSEDQKNFHLPRILKGEAVWCQGFSEPGAGSDLAGLRCRGTVEGDHIVVNGSKIWTSFAQFADYQELLIRTEPDSLKHRGLSWVICDMATPGITVRQIEAIDGEYHNCEVFYDDVRIPIANVVGEIGDGWSVAMATLSFERGTAFMQVQLEQARAVDALIRLAGERAGLDGRPLIADEALAGRLARLRGEVAAARAMIYMTASRGLHQNSPGPEGTFVPLFFAELSQRVQAAAMDILGPDSLYYDAHDIEAWSHKYLRALANTILGGTSETERDSSLWGELAALGCFGLSQPEAVGGIGLTLAEEVLAFREYGRFLLSPAVLGTVVAARIAADANDTTLAAALIDGCRRAVVGNRTAGGVQLFDLGEGDLVAVWDDDGAALYDATSFGPVESRDCFDGAVSLGLAREPVDAVARVAGDGLARFGALLIAALLTGIVEGARDMAVDYAKTRTQFGQPIGAFQAIKHKCADIGLGAEASWAQTAYAALVAGQDTSDAAFQAWNAKMIAGTAALDATRTNIQIYGGMGFTAEIDAHLYLKRAHLLNELGGSLRTLGAKLLSLPNAA